MHRKLALALLLLSATLAFGQEEPPPPEPVTMTIEVGSRSPERSRTDTPVPVDVVPIEEIADETGQLDLGQLLQFVAPSFNSNRQSASDGIRCWCSSTANGGTPRRSFTSSDRAGAARWEPI